MPDGLNGASGTHPTRLESPKVRPVDGLVFFLDEFNEAKHTAESALGGFVRGCIDDDHTKRSRPAMARSRDAGGRVGAGVGGYQVYAGLVNDVRVRMLWKALAGAPAEGSEPQRARLCVN